VYHVTSCTDDTRLTLTTAFGAQNEGSAVVNSSYSWVPTNNTSCGTSLAAYCKAGGGDLNLVRLAAGATAWVYNKTGIAGYKTKADEWFATAFGGPAAGPTASTTLNTFSTPCPGRGCGGPNASGWIGDSAGSLPDCNTSPAPCTNNGSGPFGYLGKNFGEAAGAPGADNELAWRLGGLAPSVNRTLYVSFNLASVPNATQVKVTLTEPDGAVVTGTCSSSPCAVETDARQGNDAGQTAYLSATGAVLALGDPTVFVVE
ncbi:MAG: hypothetical protein ACRD2O_18125, partial [Terriglobia bacterium]